LGEERVDRRLAAIFAGDVAGYSRLMGADEEGTLRQLKAHRKALVDPKITEHRGRIVKTTGDGMLVEFSSVLDAVRCAVDIQRGMLERNAEVPPELRIEFRIGINVGDIIIDGDDIFGDGVNVAARLEALAEPGGICVSRTVHDQVRDKLSFSFEDMGEQAVKNIARPVGVHRVQIAETVALVTVKSAAAASPAEPAGSTRPSIAVLPFSNISGDPEQEYFADGIVEDIITALSRFESLFVIARNSSFTYKGKAVDIKQVGRELGVRYVLEGSVRKAGGRVRITGQLIDSQTGAHLWADHFDGELKDIFDLQDQVTGRLVAAVAPRLTHAEIERTKRRPVESLDAYDCFLRGLALFEQRTKEAYAQARVLFERAIALDPSFSTPYAMIARCHATAQLHGWNTEPSHDQAEVRRLAERVSTLGNDDALALSSVGFALAWVCRDYDAAAAFVDRALSVNPNLVHAWMNRAMVSSLQGEHEKAIEQFARARRISPIGPDYYLVQGYLGLCHLMMGRYDEALRCGADAASHQPHWLTGHLVFTMANGLAGNIEEAHKSLAELRRLNPTLRLSNVAAIYSYRRAEDRARLVEGLRPAGLPE
jgi:TolB-like protein/class 3 adenylate cyclase